MEPATTTSGKSFTLTFEAVYPATHSESGETGSPGRWLKAVEEASNGRIKFERHWGGDPVPAARMLKACGAGTVDITL